MPTYQSRPVFDFTPHWVGPAQTLTDDVTMDPVVAGGIALPWVEADQAQAILTFSYKLTRAEVAALWAFQDSTRGRLQGFWLPSWCHDYQLQTDKGSTATTLEIDPVGLSALWDEFPDQYAHLCFFLSHPSPSALTPSLLCLRAQTIAAGADAEVLTFASTIGQAVTRTMRCSRLYYVRFADAQIRLRWHTDELAEATIRFVELPREYAAAELGTRPVWLYRVTRGSYEWTWAGYPVAIVAAGRTWAAAPIKHGGLTFDKEFEDEATLTFATASAAHLFRSYLASPAIEPTHLQIFATEAPAFAVDLAAPIYEGDLGAPRYRPRGVIELAISSPLGAEDWPVPRHQLQRPCNYMTYEASTCRLASASLTVTAAITAIGANYIEAAAFGAEATARANANWFALGDAQIGSEVRNVVSQSGNRLNLDAPFLAAKLGDTAIVRWGCDGLRASCLARGNLVNYGGYADMPSTDPKMAGMEAPGGGGKK